MGQNFETVEQRIRDHIDDYWPNHQKEYFSWTLGPISRYLPNFRVCRISPLSESDSWIYITIGAWEVIKTSRKERLEFFVISPTEEALHIELLAMVVNFYADEKYDLYLGKTMDIGRPWLNESPCDHLLVSLPYPFGEKLEWCQVSDELAVRFLWLLPIHQSEADLVNTQGIEALENRFDEEEIDYLDVHRPPVH